MKMLLFIVMILFISNIPIINVFVAPITYLGTVIHEASHVIAAYLTGGYAIQSQINMNGSGHAITVGGNQMVIFSAGYLGTSLVGSLSLLLITHHYKTVISFLLMFVVVLLPFSFTSPFSILVLAGYTFLLCNFLNNQQTMIRETVMLTICSLIVLNSFSDMFMLLGMDSSSTSDAHQLARITGIPAFIWGSAWLLISGTCFYLALINNKKL